MIKFVPTETNADNETFNEEKFLDEELPIIYNNSTVFFSDRLANAFPGQRGLQWYEPKESVKRLKIFFKEPLRFKTIENNYDVDSDPIWWFRGMSGLFIQEFKTLSKTKILLGHDEIEIKRILVNINTLYYRSFIYVETKAEKPSGVCDITEENIQSHIKSMGYSAEEYALFGKKKITRQQYDDGDFLLSE